MCSCCSIVLVCNLSLLSFFDAPFIVRVINVSVVRERHRLVGYSTAHSAFAEFESDCLVRMLSPMYYLQNTCTFSSLTSDQFELQRSLIRNSESLPRSSELKARGI